MYYAALHFIGDFPCQSTWMIQEKGRRWEVLAYHCLVYTSVFALADLHPNLSIGPIALLVIFSSHMLIDAAKSRWKIVKEIWIDQLLHLSVLALLQLAGIL